jgi:hypothetical protein
MVPDVIEKPGVRVLVLQGSIVGGRIAVMENDTKVCPECGHEFKGNGFDGIDAHWRAKHEDVMPYEEAWPLIQSGEYERSGDTKE